MLLSLLQFLDQQLSLYTFTLNIYRIQSDKDDIKLDISVEIELFRSNQ